MIEVGCAAPLVVACEADCLVFSGAESDVY
jgi:hypothetical protein